ncbi:MAG: hypothetical protein HA496_01610 [Thaumarchaeota archaeon]|jgi:hypothetical protein|nr:hypothetical protein [Nitrososphaerota archaeon]
MSEVTLSMVYEEVRKLSKKLDFLEEIIEEIVIRELPKARLSDEEVSEIKSSLEQMKKGDYVTLEELMNA